MIYRSSLPLLLIGFLVMKQILLEKNFKHFKDSRPIELHVCDITCESLASRSASFPAVLEYSITVRVLGFFLILQILFSYNKEFRKNQLNPSCIPTTANTVGNPSPLPPFLPCVLMSHLP